MEFEKLDFFNGIETGQIWVYNDAPDGDSFKIIMLETDLKTDEDGVDCNVRFKNQSTGGTVDHTKKEVLALMQKVS